MQEVRPIEGSAYIGLKYAVCIRHDVFLLVGIIGLAPIRLFKPLVFETNAATNYAKSP